MRRRHGEPYRFSHTAFFLWAVLPSLVGVIGFILVGYVGTGLGMGVILGLGITAL
jgi:hypothetical protein